MRAIIGQMDLEDAANEARASVEASDLVARLADRVGGAARAEAVFGEPVERGGLTVIPVARAAWGFGGGGGGDADQQGSGGGGGGTVRPLGYIEVRENEARFVPLRSPRTAALAAAGGAAVLGAALGGYLRRR